jgi:hypothetical protein
MKSKAMEKSMNIENNLKFPGQFVQVNRTLVVRQVVINGSTTYVFLTVDTVAADPKPIPFTA